MTRNVKISKIIRKIINKIKYQFQVLVFQVKIISSNLNCKMMSKITIKFPHHFNLVLLLLNNNLLFNLKNYKILMKKQFKSLNK